MRIAVVPARGGSKRIPRKNIKDFGGRPMLAWSLEVALKSALFDRVIVSTDDPEIAEVARSWGGEVPFMRPAAISDDFTGTVAVVKHAIETLIETGERPQVVCCIYPTAPLLEVVDLQAGLEKLVSSGANYAFSATRFSFPIQRALRIRDDGLAEMFHPEHWNTRSQDLEPAYHDAAQFYWGRAQAWLAARPIFESGAPVILPSFRVQDIDNPEDWRRAELIFRMLRGS